MVGQIFLLRAFFCVFYPLSCIGFEIMLPVGDLDTVHAFCYCQSPYVERGYKVFKTKGGCVLHLGFFSRSDNKVAVNFKCAGADSGVGEFKVVLSGEGCCSGTRVVFIPSLYRCMYLQGRELDADKKYRKKYKGRVSKVRLNDEKDIIKSLNLVWNIKSSNQKDARENSELDAFKKKVSRNGSIQIEDGYGLLQLRIDSSKVDGGYICMDLPKCYVLNSGLSEWERYGCSEPHGVGLYRLAGSDFGWLDKYTGDIPATSGYNLKKIKLFDDGIRGTESDDAALILICHSVEGSLSPNTQRRVHVWAIPYSREGYSYREKNTAIVKAHRRVVELHGEYQGKPFACTEAIKGEGDIDCGDDLFKVDKKMQEIFYRGRVFELLIQLCDDQDNAVKNIMLLNLVKTLFGESSKVNFSFMKADGHIDVVMLNNLLATYSTKFGVLFRKIESLGLRVVEDVSGQIGIYDHFARWIDRNNGFLREKLLCENGSSMGERLFNYIKNSCFNKSVSGSLKLKQERVEMCYKMDAVLEGVMPLLNDAQKVIVIDAARMPIKGSLLVADCFEKEVGGFKRSRIVHAELIRTVRRLSGEPVIFFVKYGKRGYRLLCRQEEFLSFCCAEPVKALIPFSNLESCQRNVTGGDGDQYFCEFCNSGFNREAKLKAHKKRCKQSECEGPARKKKKNN